MAREGCSEQGLPRQAAPLVTRIGPAGVPSQVPVAGQIFGGWSDAGLRLVASTTRASPVSVSEFIVMKVSSTHRQLRLWPVVGSWPGAHRAPVALDFLAV